MSEKGKIIRIAQEGFEINSRTYLDDFDDITQNAGTKVEYQSEKEISYGDSEDIKIEQKSEIKIKGWWTDKKGRKITKANLGETVHFHLKFENYPKGIEFPFLEQIIVYEHNVNYITGNTELLKIRLNNKQIKSNHIFESTFRFGMETISR